MQIIGGGKTGIRHRCRLVDELQHREIGSAVLTDQGRLALAAIAKYHAVVATMIDDMGIGDDVALRRHHGAATTAHAELGLTGLEILAHHEDADHVRHHRITGAGNGLRVSCDAGFECSNSPRPQEGGGERSAGK